MRVWPFWLRLLTYLRLLGLPCVCLCPEITRVSRAYHKSPSDKCSYERAAIPWHYFRNSCSIFFLFKLSHYSFCHRGLNIVPSGKWVCMRYWFTVSCHCSSGFRRSRNYVRSLCKWSIDISWPAANKSVCLAQGSQNFIQTEQFLH